MVKVMLVDDDAPMIKYLLNLIPWDELRLQIVATAQSATKALQLFQTTEPDLVVTDIGMPKMDGIEMVDQMKRLRPELRVIFLTCHEDFGYAKEAIKLNADGYLIKDELTADELKRTVKKATMLIDIIQDSTEKISYQEEVARNRDLLKRSFWKQIVSGNDSAGVMNSGKRLGINWGGSCFILGRIHIDYSSLILNYSLKDKHTIKYALYNIAQEFTENMNGFTIFSDDSQEDDEYQDLICVMNYRKNLVENSYESYRRFATELNNKIQAYLKIEIFFVYGNEFQGLDRIGKAMENLKQFNQSLYYDTAMIRGMPSNIESNIYTDSLFLINRNVKEALIQAYHDKELKSACNVIDNLAQQAEEDKTLPSLLISQFRQLVQILENESGHINDQTRFHSGLMHTERLQETLKSVKEWVRKMMTSNEYSNVIITKTQVIDRYISEHLSENMTLVSMANYLYLNPSYFSRYFKKLTGVNFTDYVHRYKMNVAIEMMKNKEMTTEMISIKLGYSDRTYFSKVFKKYCGISPGDYKSNIG